MAKEDLEKLLNVLFEFAMEMLGKHGEFFPFGAQMDLNGQVACVGGHTGVEQPAPQEIIALLIKGFGQAAQRDEIRAAGMCYDVRISPTGDGKKSDAVCAQLEHKDGEVRMIYLPYKKGWLGKYKFGEIVATAADPAIFKRSL